LYHAIRDTAFSPAEYRVTPLLPFPIEEREPGHQAQIPPLIKGYLRGGAWICGEPAWDPDFHSADFFMMLPLAKLDKRYARHYLKETNEI
jgi:putative hemolysin